MTTELLVPPGLDGVVVADTQIGGVRGHEGMFHYRQHSAPELAENCGLEAVWHLLHVGWLPDADELEAFSAEVALLRQPPPAVVAALPILAAAGGSPNAAVRTAWSMAGQTLDFGPWLDLDGTTVADQALTMAAMLPTLVAAVWRLQQGEPAIEPDLSLRAAEDYLRMLGGGVPSAVAVRAVERYLVLTIDHGFNASTFVGRAITSTGADVGAAMIGAMGSLSGPLHGGAPSRALDMLRAIERPERAEAWIDDSLAHGERIMGFGHRVYRTEDPRSALLKQTALEMGGPLVDLAVACEAAILDALQRHRPDRELRTNVEYYAGVVLHLAGVPQELFSPTFAVSRAIGWSAHVREQMLNNRIIRPKANYTGPSPD